jgi:hypothetical protein
VWLNRSRLGDGLPAIQYFVNSPFNIFLSEKVRLKPKPLNLLNSFEDSKVQLTSSYWLIHFSGLHRALLKSRRLLHAAFKESSVKIWESCLTNRKKGNKIQNRTVHALPAFERLLKIQKAFCVKRLRTSKINKIPKGE